MKKYIFYASSVWLLLSIFIIFAFYTGNTKLYWIDVPTHFVAGIMIGAVMFLASKRNIRKTIIFSFLVFIGWEFFEIIASSLSEKEFIINIFSEQKSNRIQDIIMDTLGLALFFLVYKKRLKRVKEYEMN
ncbi:MAG: hypothetical protein KAQ64_04575 [Candidatus Pacebacteria bacterium]|nr:hypothetical protein [Candidatus Paceibacterota bacterium]